MSPFLANGDFPSIKNFTLNDVTTDERVTAIDFVNRHNFLFEEYNHDKLLATCLPNIVLYHVEGTIRGHAELRKFWETVYGSFIPGINRANANHVVDRDEDGGVIVRYHIYLVRNQWPDESGKTVAGDGVANDNGLPAIWWYSPMIDRLRMTPDGWKIFERYLGASARNVKFDLGNKPVTA
ncbi:hypothetical protein BX600DRAFT_440345 [Xylariales sp. PMI_506]|nr:hypothetical protein BX600DRAFT_440345 [Xylariales sp. PMI_506]